MINALATINNKATFAIYKAAYMKLTRLSAQATRGSRCHVKYVALPNNSQYEKVRDKWDLLNLTLKPYN